MHPEHELLFKAYGAFNARDIDAALSVLHPKVEWPNRVDGGYVHGHDEVRAYWTRQWQTIDPQVEPLIFGIDENRRILVYANQVVRDLSGAVLSEQRVLHIYEFVDGLVMRMEIGQDI